MKNTTNTLAISEAAGAKLADGLNRRHTLAARLRRGEEGLSTVEVVLIIFVAVVILLVLLQVIWPQVLQNVMQKLSDLFSQTGRG